MNGVLQFTQHTTSSIFITLAKNDPFTGKKKGRNLRKNNKRGIPFPGIDVLRRLSNS